MQDGFCGLSGSLLIIVILANGPLRVPEPGGSQREGVLGGDDWKDLKISRNEDCILGVRFHEARKLSIRGHEWMSLARS